MGLASSSSQLNPHAHAVGVFVNEEIFAVSAFPLPSLFRRARIATAIAFLVSLTVVVAQPANQKPPPNLGEKTSEAFGKLKAMQDAKNWEGMIKMLDSVPGVAPGSYDEVVILDTKAKIFGAMEQYGKALAPWERALELADRHGYFSETATLEIVGYLAQLYAQEALPLKDSKRQQEYFAKSLTYFRRLLESSRKPTPEALITYASILFQKATADPAHLDAALLAEARQVVDRGLLLAVKPKDGFYHLRLALLQQESDFAGASDLIELLLQRKSDNKEYWQALVNIYLQLSAKAKDAEPTLSREYMVRAIVTYERAQALGFLTTPKDNLNRVSLYLSANQFTRGTEVLYDGLKNGTIDSEPVNWRLLGRFYQEANRPGDALVVLKEAAERFPASGEIEAQLAHLCIQMENTEQAFAHARSAAAKGNFEGTTAFSVYYLIAYLACDLGRFDDAQEAIAAAEKYPAEVSKDAQFPTLKAIVASALAERERKTKETESKAATPTPKSSGS